MIKDALNLLRLQAHNIKHYEKYSISSILLIFLLLEIPSYLTDGLPTPSYLEILGDFTITIFAFLFFIYWLFRKVKEYSFTLACKFFGVLNIGLTIAIIITQIITLAIGSSADNNYTLSVLFLYIIYVTGITTSKAMGVSKAYALSGITLSILLLIVVFTIYLMLAMPSLYFE